MNKTKKIVFALICIFSIITSITLVTFADVVDKGSYTFDTETGKITPKEQAVFMERYPLPLEDGKIVHNAYFTTIGNTFNYQLDITLLSANGSKTISFAFPAPDPTKSYTIYFNGGDFEVRLSPQLLLEDGRIYYHLTTVSYTMEGDFGYFYDDFYATIVEKPTPIASQSISDYVISLKEQQINQLNFDVQVERENARHYYEMYEQKIEELHLKQIELDNANEALDQGNWFMSFFNGIANAVLTFIQTIGAFEVGGISVLSVISVAIVIIVLFIVIKVVRA